jgi:methyl-accepting chemotaxis protein
MNFGKMKISLKVMLVIAVLSFVSISITVGSVFGLKTINDISDRQNQLGEEATLLTLMTQNVMGLNRAEFHVASIPTTETLEGAHKSVGGHTKAFEERLAKFKNRAGDEGAADAEKIEALFQDYLTTMNHTLSVAETSLAAIQIDAAQQQIGEAAATSRLTSKKLEAMTGDMVASLVDRGAKLSTDATRLYQLASIVMIVGAAIGIVCGVLLGLMVSQKGIVTPIRKIVDSLKGLAGGDLNTAVFGADRTDEVGEIAATTQVFKENLIESQRLREEQENARAEREKRQTVVNAAITRFQTAAEEIVRSVAAAATELQASANVMSASAIEAAQQSSSVAAAAELTSANVQSVASATEELAASVREIGARAQESHTVTRSAVDEVTLTNAMVGELETAAQKIGAVVSLIGDIAAQTNLLALNATIEAARAGDSGKGFAVVAGEVKSLAEQAARATEEITREIDGIQGVTRKSVGAMAAISTRINEISSIASTIASAVQEQSAATQEISRNVQEASTGTSDVTANIGSVSTAVNDTGSAATQVQSAASELAQQSSDLRREFETFIDVVRAA